MKIKNSQVRAILYGLRTQWGQKITLSLRTVTTNYDTGTRIPVDEVVATIRKAVVLPEEISTETITLISSTIMENKGVVASGGRFVLVDGRQTRGVEIDIGMIAEIDGIDMELAQKPIVILGDQGYFLLFRRKA